MDTIDLSSESDSDNKKKTVQEKCSSEVEGSGEEAKAKPASKKCLKAVAIKAKESSSVAEIS